MPSYALDKKEKDLEGEEKVPVIFSKRWILAYIGFFGFMFIYSLRVNMSVAIVCMVKDINTTTTNDSIIDSSCSPSSDEKNERGEFDWDKSIQTFMLSSFFYGYIALQVPGGWLAGRFGGKKVLGFGVLITAIATVLVPVAARWDYRAVYALRAIMGLAEGVSFPAMHAIWGRWAPPMERTRLSSFCYNGLNIGNIITYITSGLLCAYGFDNGWGSVFYVTGGSAFIWVFVWFMFVYDTPEKHPTISEAEKNYIVKSRGDNEKPEDFKVPWFSIVKSRAMWVCLAAHFCNNWMHYTLLTGLPSYMKKVLHFDIKQNGVLSSVPYMVMTFSILFAGQAADFLRSRCLSTTATRRLFQASSFIGSGACIVSLGFIDCEHRTIAVVLLALGVGIEGLCYAGYMVNQVDFAPKYAGLLFGITNFISTIPGIVAPTVTGALTPNDTQEEWRNVFYVCGAFCLFGTIVFGSFAQGELEPWAQDMPELEMDLSVDNKDQDKAGHTNSAFSHSDDLNEKPNSQETSFNKD